MSFVGEVAMAVVSPWGRECAHLLPPLLRRALFSLLLVSAALAPALVTYVAAAVVISQFCELPVQGIAKLILAVSPHPWAVAVLATAPVLAATCVLATCPRSEPHPAMVHARLHGLVPSPGLPPGK